MTSVAFSEIPECQAVLSYPKVRERTERLASPLSAEDQTVQSMPDASPTKWHLAHTSWFFETFVLGPSVASYHRFHPAYGYLFNSYYEAAGPRHPRPERGMITRPGVAEVASYRTHVDEAMARFLTDPPGEGAARLVELGLHHEQQHQELLLMDIKHLLSRNPLAPDYAPATSATAPASRAGDNGWVGHDGGLVEIGHGGKGFCFDNETPRHAVLLAPFELAGALVTNGEWLAFIDDGGYRRPELWLSEGWATAQAKGWQAPLYWSHVDGEWRQFTLTGDRPVDPVGPVCHVSLFEADAYARWAGARLPIEFEWEAVAAGLPAVGNALGTEALHPRSPTAGDQAFFGEVWQWTSSAYAPYPGYRPARGAVGEYNGKFMVNQYVLRGGSCVTPVGHAHLTYRNFFPASTRWAFAGLRLARDASPRGRAHLPKPLGMGGRGPAPGGDRPPPAQEETRPKERSQPDDLHPVAKP